MLFIRASLLSDYATEDKKGKIVLAGIFTNINAESFPSRHLQLFLYTAFTGDPGEYSLMIQIVSPKGEAIFDTSKQSNEKATKIAGPELKIRIPDAEPRTSSWTVGISGLEFPEPGVYHVRYIIDGNPYGYEYPFTVTQVKKET